LLYFKVAQEAVQTAFKNFYLEAVYRHGDQPEEFLKQGEETMATLRGLANEGANLATIRGKMVDHISK
jgi:hypothetical protein